MYRYSALLNILLIKFQSFLHIITKQIILLCYSLFLFSMKRKTIIFNFDSKIIRICISVFYMYNVQYKNIP